MIVESYVQRGSSCPIILDISEEKYFVKLRSGMSGKYALVSEWIGNKLGAQLNLKTQIPNWIVLGDDLKVENINVEVKELIHKSLGLNIGFEYYQDAKEVKSSQLKRLSKKEANEIFLFDLMMINIDRTPSNSNLMQVDGVVYSIDYESSLLFQEIIENKNLLEDERILQCLKNNPLYEDIDEKTIAEFIEKTEELSVKEIIEEIPLSYLNKDNRIAFTKGIEKKKGRQWFLKDTMKKLKNIKTESQEEQKIRRNKNQEEFMRKFKERSVS